MSGISVPRIPAAATFRDVQLNHSWFWIFNPFPDCSMMPLANIINMTNHWSSQLRRQSPNPITLTDLEDLQSFTFINPICSDSQVPRMYQVCVVPHIALNGCHFFQRNLTFPRCREESTTCSITSMIDPKKDRPVKSPCFFVGIWQQGTHEPSGGNNKTVMFWCVTAIRIKRFQFSESWWVLDGRHTN